MNLCDKHINGKAMAHGCTVAILMVSMRLIVSRILKNLLFKGQNNAQDMAKPSECQTQGMLDGFAVMKLFHFS